MKGLAESGHNYFRVPFAICVYFLKSAQIKLPPKHLRGVKQKYTGRSEKTHQCLARAKEEVDNISKKPIGMKWGRAGLKGQKYIKWFINPIFPYPYHTRAQVFHAFNLSLRPTKAKSTLALL